MANIVPIEIIENKILLIRGKKVILDRDLAALYGVKTKVLNQAVKRNKERFPDDFMFQLARMEAEYLISEGYLGESLRSQFVTLNGNDAKNKRKTKISRSQFATLKFEWGKNIKYLPHVFTEQGVAMLSSVLKSKRAVEVNIAIMRTFVKIRRMAGSYKDLAKRIDRLEKSQDTQGKRFSEIFKILDNLGKEETRKEIGFKG